MPRDCKQRKMAHPVTAEPGSNMTSIDESTRAAAADGWSTDETSVEASVRLPELLQLLEGKYILLLGDSVAHDLGQRHLAKLGVPYKYADEANMRGSDPEQIRTQVCDRMGSLKPCMDGLVRHAGLVILSAGKNIMRNNTMEYVATQVLNCLLKPLLHAKPAGVPLVFVSPTRARDLGFPDEVAKHLKSIRLEAQYSDFAIATRDEVGLEGDDFLLEDGLHLRACGMERVIAEVVGKMRMLKTRTNGAGLMSASPRPVDSAVEAAQATASEADDAVTPFQVGGGLHVGGWPATVLAVDSSSRKVLVRFTGYPQSKWYTFDRCISLASSPPTIVSSVRSTRCPASAGGRASRRQRAACTTGTAAASQEEGPAAARLQPAEFAAATDLTDVSDAAGAATGTRDEAEATLERPHEARQVAGRLRWHSTPLPTHLDAAVAAALSPAGAPVSGEGGPGRAAREATVGCASTFEEQLHVAEAAANEARTALMEREAEADVLAKDLVEARRLYTQQGDAVRNLEDEVRAIQARLAFMKKTARAIAEEQESLQGRSTACEAAKRACQGAKRKAEGHLAELRKKQQRIHELEAEATRRRREAEVALKAAEAAEAAVSSERARPVDYPRGNR